MNTLNVDDIKQVPGAIYNDPCAYHLNFIVTATSSATPGVVELIADLFNGNINDIYSFLSELNESILSGTDFNEVAVSNLSLIPGCIPIERLCHRYKRKKFD